VGLRRLEIGVQRADQARERSVELPLVGERNPVAVADLGRKLAVGDRIAQHGHDPLRHLPRVFHLVLAVGRGDRSRGDHEHERVGLLDRPLDRLREDLAVGDPLDIQPDRLAAIFDRLREPRDELRVPSRVGEEHVGHGALAQIRLRTATTEVTASP
jgi:hypothetical protein